MVKRCCYGFVFAAVLALGVPASAQKPATAPSGATAQCSDGTFSTAKTEKGACSKHGGVKTWFGAADATPKEASGKAPAKSSAKAPAATEKAPAPPAAPKNATVAPPGATGQCTDGSYTRAKTQSGACSNHGGVKTWYAATVPPAAAPAKAAPTKAAPMSPAPAAPAPTTTAPANPAPRTMPPPPAAAPKAAPAQKAPAGSAKAQTVAPPPGTPDNATAKCKDGTYSFAKGHSGACSRHGGVAEWYK